MLSSCPPTHPPTHPPEPNKASFCTSVVSSSP
jgi:hypothetical protein